MKCITPLHRIRVISSLKNWEKERRNTSLRRAVCGTSYYFKLRPLRKVKKNITYLEESNPVTTSTVSDPVKNLKAKAQKNGKVRLTWKKARGIGTYVIFRSDSSNGEYRQIGITGKFLHEYRTGDWKDLLLQSVWCTGQLSDR